MNAATKVRLGHIIVGFAILAIATWFGLDPSYLEANDQDKKSGSTTQPEKTDETPKSTGLQKDAEKPRYEFPTDVWRVVSLLEDLGFREVDVHPHTAYPNIGRLRYGLYRALGRFRRVRRYHNYHYMLSAVRN